MRPHVRAPIALLVILGVSAGCQDSTGPAPTTSRPTLNALRWSGTTRPRALRGLSPSIVAAPAGIAAIPPIGGPVPSPSSVTFWAYTNQASSAEIDYLASDSSWQPYVTLSIPAGALFRRPDGSSFGLVDSIPVSMSVDSTQVYVQVEPTGLKFNWLNPATLKIWYAGADPDLNGDGLVNFLDSWIEHWLLGVWVQEDSLDPWSLVSSVQNLLEKSFTAQLRHFSGYAVSY
jgi:hypothetical protein